MTDTRVVERLAATVVDFEFAGAENFECFFECLRATALARADSAGTGLEGAALRVRRRLRSRTGRGGKLFAVVSADLLVTGWGWVLSKTRRRGTLARPWVHNSQRR